jgi:OmcA/MtrC family decaheme c-type cytochrome
MAKRQLQFWLSAAVLGLLVACGGGGGGDRAAGVDPGPAAPGGPVTPPPPILPGPVGYADAEEIFAFILSASIPDDGLAVVDYQLTDGNGTAIIDLEVGDTRYVIAKLEGSPLGNLTGSWQSYRNQIEDPDGVGIGTEDKLQATYERDGEFTNFGDGTYRYKYATNVNDLPADILAQAKQEGLNLSYKPDLTHRVAIQFDGGPNPQNPFYDFVPVTGDTGGDIFHMQIAETVNCNRCHDELGMHGGNRVDVEYCVTCHNPGSSDANSTNTVDMKVMIHKLHRGANLPSVEAGGEYAIYGFRDSKHDYSHVEFPQDIRNCQNCHVGTGTTNDFYEDVLLTNQGDNWNEFPSRAACGSCHDDVNFDNHAGGQPDDSKCVSCHSTGERAGSPAESHAMLVRNEGAKFKAEVLNVENSGPGEFPSVDIKVTNPATGAAYDILSDAPFTNAGASLNVKLAWDTADYHNTGNGADNSSDISQSALSTATPNGDGSFRVEYQQAIPSGGLASGSGAAVIDGHPTVVLEEGADPTNIYITDAVGYYSIDEADGTASPRRQSVAIKQCQSCHQNLVLHGGNRADNVNSCVTCHNPRNTDRDVREIAANPPTDGKDEESIDFKTMVHAIHASAMRENPLQVVGFRGFSTHVYDEEHVQYPGILSNCQTCHVDGGYTLPLASSVLGNTIDTGTDHQSPVDDTVITPTSAVCYACHENDVAKAHMESNGGNFATSQAAIDSGEVIEQCELCHGEGRSADLDLVHGLD